MSGDAIKGQPAEFFPKNRFILEADGIEYGGFTTCSEIGGEIEAIVHREGGMRGEYKADGNVSYPEVTLERGLSTNTELYDWWNGIRRGTLTGDDKRRTVRVIQRDEADADRVVFTLYRAWPRTWKGGTFDKKASEVTVESCVLVFEDFERTDL